jgi:hypothetical protein
MNHNNSAALNKEILGVSQYVEPNLFDSGQKHFLKNIRVVNSNTMNYVGLGLILIYILFRK